MTFLEFKRALGFLKTAWGRDTFVRARSRYFLSVILRLAHGFRRYTLLGIKTLGSGVSPARPCYEITLRGPWWVRHQPGDTLMLGWHNHEEEVDQLLALLKTDPDTPCVFRGSPAPLAPLRTYRGSLKTILTQQVEIRKMSDGLMKHLGLEKPRAEGPVSAGQHPGGQQAPTFPLTHLLGQRAEPPSPQLLLSHQPGCQGRLYSLSSVRSGWGGDEVQILLRSVENTFLTEAGILGSQPGRASGFISRLFHRQSWGQPLPAVSFAHPFRLDAGPKGTPQIALATGTGIASVLCALRSGKVQTPFWLLYGVRNWEEEGLYKEELLDALQGGRIQRIDVALSQPSSFDRPTALEVSPLPGLHFHRGTRLPGVLPALRNELTDWLGREARIYGCGHAGLGQELEKELISLLVAAGKAADQKTAEVLLEGWKTSRRLQLSVS